MTLENIGYNEDLEHFKIENGLDSFLIGRVISEHKERYIVKTETKEFNSEILGNLRFTAQNRSDFPAVGDWVAISEFENDKAIIHKVFPRKSILERQTVGKKGEKQIIATNIDFAFIIQSVNRDFSINRFERYLTMCYSSNVSPILVLSKIDLIDQEQLSNLIVEIKQRIKNVPILTISNKTKEGIKTINETIIKNKTYCLLGSSGVGKSSLLNSLSDKELMKTEEISQFSDRGKHVTTHRELKILDNGGILIDNPGMREIGMTDNSSGLEITFDVITELANECRFKDCSHTSEKGCAVLKAVEVGRIDTKTYENYIKMEREKFHFESTIAERRKKDKDFGKMLKNYKKENY